MEENDQHSRIAVLDGLRALAIILVLMRHSLKPFEPWGDISLLPIGPFDLKDFFWNGWIGVDLFFILSGFLITSQLIRGFSAPSADFSAVLKKFYWRRFWRIAPAYYVVMLIVAAGFFPYFPLGDDKAASAWQITYHLLFLQDYLPPDICVTFWSVAVELKYYLIAPFLIWVLLRRSNDNKSIIILSGLIVFTLIARLATWNFSMPATTTFGTYFLDLRIPFHLCLDGLVMGTICAFLWHGEKLKALISRPAVANSLFFAGLTLFLVMTIPPRFVGDTAGWFQQVFFTTLVTLGFGAMTVGLLGRAKGSWLFEGRPLKFIARISYSLYLVHYPLIPLSYLLVNQLYGIETLPFVQAYLLFLIPFLGLSVALSCLLYYLVEQPFIKWSKTGKFGL